ncbi:hypothetical protein WJX81_005287 [Elliptochloris bilobata]|uniref:Uncharacterized protein n=1 Tax=Elliptochloris bilobata TaxID=381761 RepID=A0AAW1R2I2_9CHLO
MCEVTRTKRSRRRRAQKAPADAAAPAAALLAAPDSKESTAKEKALPATAVTVEKPLKSGTFTAAELGGLAQKGAFIFNESSKAYQEQPPSPLVWTRQVLCCVPKAMAEEPAMLFGDFDYGEVQALTCQHAAPPGACPTQPAAAPNNTRATDVTRTGSPAAKPPAKAPSCNLDCIEPLIAHLRVATTQPPKDLPRGLPLQKLDLGAALEAALAQPKHAARHRNRDRAKPKPAPCGRSDIAVKEARTSATSRATPELIKAGWAGLMLAPNRSRCWSSRERQKGELADK